MSKPSARPKAPHTRKKALVDGLPGAVHDAFEGIFPGEKKKKRRLARQRLSSVARLWLAQTDDIVSEADDVAAFSARLGVAVLAADDLCAAPPAWLGGGEFRARFGHKRDIRELVLPQAAYCSVLHPQASRAQLVPLLERQIAEVLDYTDRLRRCTEADEAAGRDWSSIVRDHKESIRLMAGFLAGGERQLAVDLQQAALDRLEDLVIAMVGGRELPVPQSPPDRPLKDYLETVARNQMRRTLRDLGRLLPTAGDAAADAADLVSDPAREVENTEGARQAARREVRPAGGRLPTGQWQVVLLKRFEALPDKVIAELLCVTVRIVEQAMKRARPKLGPSWSTTTETQPETEAETQADTEARNPEATS